MRTTIIVAKLNDERNVIARLAKAFAKEMEKQGVEVTIFPFKSIFDKCPQVADNIIVMNVGKQAVWACFQKKKPIIAISFGSDIREQTNFWVRQFSRLCAHKVDLLYCINPDCVDIAKRLGYKDVRYIPNWSEALV